MFKLMPTASRLATLSRTATTTIVTALTASKVLTIIRSASTTIKVAVTASRLAGFVRSATATIVFAATGLRGAVGFTKTATVTIVVNAIGGGSWVTSRIMKFVSTIWRKNTTTSKPTAYPSIASTLSRDLTITSTLEVREV